MRISNFREPLCVAKIGCLICPEAVVPRCCSFYVFLKISQNLQESVCAGVCSNKVAGVQSETLLKKRLSRVFSCEFSEIFRNTFFYRYLQTTASSCYFLFGKWWTFKKTVFSARCNFSEMKKRMIKEINSVQGQTLLRLNQPLSMPFQINGVIKLHNIQQTVQIWFTEP